MAERKQREQTTVPTFRRTDRPPSSRGGGLVLITLAGENVGAIHLLDKPRMLIGRDEDADIQLEDVGVSRRHAALRWNDKVGGYVLIDLRSSNGTWVNDSRVLDGHSLQRGDKIRLGKQTVLRVSDANELEVKFAETMNAAALRDPLTQIFNRRYIEHRLASEAFARRHGTQLSIMMADIDRFKQINDEHGHVVGDAVLREFAQLSLRIIRSEDVMARFGGEEFLLLCRGIDGAGAVAAAERLRAEVQRYSFFADDRTLAITVSVGIAAFGPLLTEVEQLIEAADEALYAAKAAGRNRVVCFGDGETA